MGWFLGVFFSQSKIVFSECFLQTIGSLGCVYQKSVSSGCCFSKNVGSWMFVFLLSSKPIVGRGFFPHQNRSFRLRYKFFHVSHLSHVVGTPPTIAAASEKKRKRFDTVIRYKKARSTNGSVVGCSSLFLRLSHNTSRRYHAPLLLIIWAKRPYRPHGGGTAMTKLVCLMQGINRGPLTIWEKGSLGW